MTSVLTHHGGLGDGPGPWFLVFPLVSITVLLLAALWFRRRGGRFWRHPSTGRSVLDERYAHGESTDDEYRERLTVLKEDER